VVVLAWWTDSAANLISRMTDHEQVQFMEGPYAVEITSASQSTWEISCLEMRLSRLSKYRGVVDVGTLVSSVASASKTAMQLCREKGWWSSDIEMLDANLAALESARKDAGLDRQS